MAQNALQICNNALIKMGLSPITGFDEKTVHADILRQRYPACRDYLLTQHLWHFARRIVNLSAESGKAAGGWSYAHPLPADHGRTLDVTDYSGAKILFERIGNYLFTDIDTPVLLYIRNYGHALDDAYAYPVEFAEALACYIGADTALAITRDMNIRATLFEQYATALTYARHNGAVDTYHGPEVALWVTPEAPALSVTRTRPATVISADGTWEDFI